MVECDFSIATWKNVVSTNGEFEAKFKNDLGLLVATGSILSVSSA